MPKKFDMAALVKESLGDVRVSEVDTVRMIPVDLIDPNPKNFYEMSDLEELAGSIEAWGLVHPIKVRPVDGRYVITDGERRFRATKEILGRTEIQCIVSAQVNTLLEEMQLIEANRTQRKMSAADLSKQAERYTELLAQLKEAGVAIPGRLRDRVAEALQVSSTKLARLHAIRENSVPRALALFDDGTLNESAAYALQQLPEAHQMALAETVAVAGSGLSEFDVRDLESKLKKFESAKCDGQTCEHIRERLVFMKGQNSWNRHCEACCDHCGLLECCKCVCPKLADKVAKRKAKRKAEKDSAKAAEEEQRRKDVAAADADWARFKVLRKRQGVSLEAISAADCKLSSVSAYERRDGVAYPTWTVRDWLACYREIDVLAALADVLGVTMDEVIGRTPKGLEPRSSLNHKPAAAAWGTGDPETPGIYAVRLKVSETAPGEIHNFARWTGYSWQAVRSGKPIDMLVAYWSLLPDFEKEALT